MQPAELPSWAEQQAALLLTGLGDRWSHVQAVAAQAHRVSAALAPEDRPYLIAAWRTTSATPATEQARFPSRRRCRLRAPAGPGAAGLAGRHHSGAGFEAEERGLVDALRPEPGRGHPFGPASDGWQPCTAPGHAWTDPDLVLRWICTRHRRQLTALHAAGLANQVHWQRPGLATGPAPSREATP